MNPERERQANETSWWKRILNRVKNWWKRLRSFLFRPKVDEGVIFIHNRAFSQLKNLSVKAKAIDSRKFSDQEFLSFIRIKYYVARELDEYQGLKQSLKLLEVGLAAQDSYMAIEQTEFRYRGFKQQELYDLVEELLKREVSPDDFRHSTQRKLVEILPEIKTDEGQYAVQFYKTELDKISGHELGLQLLSLFKQYQLSDFSILRNVAELVDYLRQHKLGKLEEPVRLVMENYSTFEKLGKIIGVQGKRNTPETYARMIQYMAMLSKHKAAYIQFQRLLGTLRPWQEQYQIVQNIRREYNFWKYRQPKEFALEIPGLELYERYRQWLTDEVMV